METWLETCRQIYNRTLAMRRDAWKEQRESVSLFDTRLALTQWKKEQPEFYQVHSQVLQHVQERVNEAFKHFFRRIKEGADKKGYPRFKAEGRYKSFVFPQSGFKLHAEDELLQLSKIGNVKIKLHRPVEGKVKTLTIKRTPTGKWYACFSVEAELDPLPMSIKVVGLDLGLTHFATLSNGKTIANPRFFRQGERALAKAQRRLSKAEKGTPRHRRLKKAIAHIHERIAFKRLDFAFKLANQLIGEFGTIAVEDLNVQQMQSNNWRSINKSIGDAAWTTFINILVHKAESAGRRVTKVDPRNTTKRCSRCGKLVEKSLSERTHSCPFCGLVLDRDLNAALNILALGLQCLGENP